jgi:hypothetical protein
MEMNLARRKFMGHLALLAPSAVTIAGGTGLLVMQSGCNPTTVWQEIEKWVPLGISSFEAIVALVDPLAAPGVAAIAQLVEAGFSALSAAIDGYLNAPAADKATFAQKIELIFQQIVANIQQFITAIGQSSSPIVKVAVALIQIIVSTIEGFLGQILPTPAGHVTEFKMGRETITVTPVRRNRASYIAAWNEIVNANNIPAARLPQTR